MAILETRKLNKHFGGLHVTGNVDFALQPGEMHCLIGPNGAGKSTFFRLILGEHQPDSGQILIDGQDMKGVPANNRPSNMVFQSYAIFPHLNVGNNVAYGLRGRAPKAGS